MISLHENNLKNIINSIKIKNIYNLLEIATSRSRIEKGKFEFLVRPDDKNSPTGKWHTSSILLYWINHSKLDSQLSFFISNDWVIERLDLCMSLDVFNPLDNARTCLKHLKIV